MHIRFKKISECTYAQNINILREKLTTDFARAISYLTIVYYSSMHICVV